MKELAQIIAMVSTFFSATTPYDQQISQLLTWVHKNPKLADVIFDTPGGEGQLIDTIVKANSVSA